MKILAIALPLCKATVVVAFATTPIITRRAVNHLQLHGTLRPDASEAIAEAMKLSEELGATSNEARVAWKWTQVVTVLHL